MSNQNDLYKEVIDALEDDCALSELAKGLNKEERELKAYFDYHPLKSISRKEAEAIYPPREDYPFEPIEFKAMDDLEI
jgi:hypothetical protein